MFVRWDELKVTNEAERSLPGYRDPALVRTFDAPEALDTRFYEIRARSVLNRVPKSSRMPFRWTINPYRGCSHACRYCMRGDTPILMADGRTRPLSEILVGDRIYGTERQGTFRKYVPTTVVNHWRTIKPAFRVLLEDGTELIASAEHRFLTTRGWKYVRGHRGPGGRPHLTTKTDLMGTGAFAPSPEPSADYQRGYLAGLIHGDGCIRSYRDERGGEADWQRHVFRVRLTDAEPLARTAEYLATRGVTLREYGNYERRAGNKPTTSVQTGVRQDVERVRGLIQWPHAPTSDWSKGFLAGMFDAEGCGSRATVRIANTDPVLISWTARCFSRLGFQFTVEDAKRGNGLTFVRLRGGLREVLRFFHTVDPAITRKRVIGGVGVKTFRRLRVISIEPLGGKEELYDVTTGTGDFIANGVVSHNCFARPTHTYLGFNAREDFEKEIVVKVNAPEVLRTELRKKSWKREHVALGTNTDPYQWVEGRYKLMPGIWEALLESGTPCSVLTKSPLLLRDIDVMKKLAERVGFAANLSVPTLDEKAWRATEPHTPHPRKRLEAVAKLNAAGVPTGVLIAPLQPGINDAPEQIEPLLDLAEEAGATHISGIALHLRGEVREIFFDWLRAQRPDLLPRYERLYARGAYADAAERKRLSRLIRRPGRNPTGHGRARFTAAREPPSAPREPPSAQESLF